MVMVTASVTVGLVPAALFAASVALVMPAAVGVPVIAPVAAFRLAHAGSPVAAKLVGSFVAVIV
jgi:hypothetical protein